MSNNLCNFTVRKGDRIYCEREDCGRSIPADPGIGYAPCRSKSVPQPTVAQLPPPGLGDYVEQALTSIGVTQDRWKEAKALFGLPPDCGCDKRKEWLNQVSAWWRGR